MQLLVSVVRRRRKCSDSVEDEGKEKEVTLGRAELEASVLEIPPQRLFRFDQKFVQRISARDGTMFRANIKNMEFRTTQSRYRF
jgi:hypothetical protein